MRLAKPRISPLPESEWTDEIRAELAPAAKNFGAGPPNVMKTLARHPKLLKRWNVFANHVLFKSTLPPRDREIAILRIGWLCRAGYEWGQHVIIARKCGVTDEEIERIRRGPDAPGWGAGDAAMLRAVDELHEDAFVTDATWKALGERYDDLQRMDLVFAVGQYALVSMALNTFGVQLDAGVEGFPEE